MTDTHTFNFTDAAPSAGQKKGDPVNAMTTLQFCFEAVLNKCDAIEAKIDLLAECASSDVRGP